MIDELSEKSPIEQLLYVMAYLRSEKGCPWDRKQTHKSLKKHLQEECSELMDALENEDDENMKEELGDILMNVTLHSVMAEERGAFTFDDVVKGIVEKMIRRHPHVFGESSVADADAVVKQWEEIKAAEKSGTSQKNSILAGIPQHLPALLQAEKIQRKAAKVGFDWTSEAQIVEKIEEELEELKEVLHSCEDDKIEDELSDLLFAVTNLIRFRDKGSAEEIARRSIEKFKRRFAFIEQEVDKKGKTLEEATIDEMEHFWCEAKHLEKGQV